MKENAGALDVSEELNAQTMTEMSAFDQTRNVGDDEGFVAVDGNDAELRLERREWVVRNLRACRRDARNQSGLADVGIADQPRVRQKLQLQSKILFFTESAVLGPV